MMSFSNTGGTAASAPPGLQGHQLVLGGQKSGKSRHAEGLAAAWLSRPEARASVLATAHGHDEEMRARIARHRQDRLPGLATLEEPLQLAQALAGHSQPGHLIVVDCLTLWATNWLMPLSGEADLAGFHAEKERLLALLPELPGPVVFTSNEIGGGLIAMSREVRQFVDELGLLHQGIRARCQHLHWVVAGAVFLADATRWGAGQPPQGSAAWQWA